MVEHILITGASGTIGKHLSSLLVSKGYTVSHLGRSRHEGRIKSYVWNVEKGILEPGTLKNITTVIHLAGAGVADKRWTTERKREILESRTKSTTLLVSELKKNGNPVRTFISASAIGYYGFLNPDKTYTEEDPAGSDFLAQVTEQWEKEVDVLKSTTNIRVVKIRIGIVLSKEGGVVSAIAKPVRFFIGSPLGSGKQMISWIHIDDLGKIFLRALEDETFRGAYNAVAPSPVSNEELTRAIANMLKRPVFMPNVPGFALKLLLGEMSEIVLSGSIVLPARLKQSGFVFQYERLEPALISLLNP